MPEQAFQPEWFSKPGDTLRTLLDKRDLSPVALAECMGRDATVVQGLLSGTVAIDDRICGTFGGMRRRFGNVLASPAAAI